MKKLLIVLTFIFGNQFVSAQEIGIRFGDVSGGDVAIDGIFSLGKFSRVHADLSFGDAGVGIDALWDFLYKPVDGESLKWYVGAGPSVLLGNPDAFIGASGEIGLEYHFEEAPIAIGLDWRPTLWILENTEFHTGGFGLNVRYVF